MNTIESLNEVRKHAEKVLVEEVQPLTEELETKLFISLLTEKLIKTITESEDTQ